MGLGRGNAPRGQNNNLNKVLLMFQYHTGIHGDNVYDNACEGTVPLTMQSPAAVCSGCPCSGVQCVRYIVRKPSRQAKRRRRSK